MVKIAFWGNGLCERGTTVAMYDYAYYNKTILGNESIIIYDTTLNENVNSVIQKFEKEFIVIGVNNFTLVDNILVGTATDILYIIKAGDNNGRVSKVVKTCVHCVFHCSNPHGSVYAAISPYIKNYNSNIPVVPHMINLPENIESMRDELNIPNNAIVYGRYGGYTEFDIGYVHKIVYEVASKFSNIYFLFANTKIFCNKLPNIIHVDKIIDLNTKVKFINTCDAMIHARNMGESFGLSIAEFSTKNKPVVSTPNFKLNRNVDVAHINFLKNKGVWYNESNLYHILTTFITQDNKDEIKSKDWNAFKEYSPEKVIKIFENIFIK